MQNPKTETPTAVLNAANAASVAIFKALGKSGSHEQLFDAVLLLAVIACSGKGNLAGAEIEHNAGIFKNLLDGIIAAQVVTITAPKLTQRLM